jgi:hypothetical protein
LNVYIVYIVYPLAKHGVLENPPLTMEYFDDFPMENGGFPAMSEISGGQPALEWSQMAAWRGSCRSATKIAPRVKYDHCTCNNRFLRYVDSKFMMKYRSIKLNIN